MQGYGHLIHQIKHVSTQVSLYHNGFGVPPARSGLSCQSSDYPFTAPAVIPSIKYFWKAMNKIKIGMIEKKEPTINKS